MSESQEPSDQVLSRLRQLRDELAVQVHLGKAEAKDEWAKLESQYKDLEAKCNPAKQAVAETAAGVESAVQLAAEELKSGYERLRKLL